MLLLVPIAERHHSEANKQAICAVGNTDALYSYGICLEYLKIMLLVGFIAIFDYIFKFIWRLLKGNDFTLLILRLCT